MAFQCPDCLAEYRDGAPICSNDSCSQYWEQLGVEQDGTLGKDSFNTEQLAAWNANMQRLDAMRKSR